LYVHKQHVRMDQLIASQTSTYCPYKGYASYWSAQIDGVTVPDIAWSYEDPTPESSKIAGCLSFYPERAKVVQDVLTWFKTETP